MKTLVIPPAAQRDDNSIQMLSAWVAEKGLHCSLNIGMWEAQGHAEPTAWGILLADVIRHIGNALEQERGQHSALVIEAIMRSLHNELHDPTSEAQGEFHPGHT